VGKAQRAHHSRRGGDGGHAEPVIGRAFARPGGFAHPTICVMSCVTARRANHFSSRATSSPALARKIFRFAFDPNQPYNISHPALTRGAYRDRHGRRVRGAVAAAARARKRFSQGGLNACERGPRADERDGCGRQSRVVLAPVAGVKPAEVLRNPTGFCKAFNPPVTEAKGIRLRGEHGISRKTTAQGMPACSGCTCMLVCASLALFAHETAGAASTRHSLRPLFSRAS
jgi:hypothetical protein